jgi:hypothetical protein
MELHIMLLIPGPCYFLHLRFKYAPQHPVLCLRFSPQCKRPSFTPIQNSRWNCRLVGFFIYSRWLWWWYIR